MTKFKMINYQVTAQLLSLHSQINFITGKGFLSSFRAHLTEILE